MTNQTNKTEQKTLNQEDHGPSLSALLMSIASSSLIFMGLAPHEDGSTKIDKNLARFNIDLLVMLKEKTKGNLSREEDQFLSQLIADLQNKFIKL